MVVTIMGRPKKYVISLTDEEINKLHAVLNNKHTSKTVKCRCQILIDLDDAHGKILTHAQCAKSNAVCEATVTNTVRVYIDGGLDAVLHLKRSENSNNARRKVDGHIEAELIKIACGPVPEGHDKWTLRLLEEKSKVILEEPVSKDTIGRALKKTKFDLTKTSIGASHPKKMPNS